MKYDCVFPDTCKLMIMKKISMYPMGFRLVVQIDRLSFLLNKGVILNGSEVASRQFSNLVNVRFMLTGLYMNLLTICRCFSQDTRINL